ncbi:amidohydrolase family protein [Brevibacterium oceani]|uniref:amidohydrolase family protein n=1 Tax=Brevibacterium oceani TaxID=358099 RepID=UPI0015E697C3|nr:amidohydrolase family protein [Brevibacterium oceani]
MTVLHNVRILDPDSPTSSAAPVDVEFSDTITAIRPAAGPDPSSAATVLPGLIDTHVHLKSRDALLMGFPTESGVTGPDDAERFLDWRTDNGVDLIKIIIEDPDATETPALDIPTLQAIVDGARKRGLLTVAHAVTTASFDRGLDAGVDVLTHIPFDRPLSEATISRIVESGTLVSPTLVMMRAIADTRLGEHADAAMELAIGNVSALLDGGATIVAGTDANETPFAPVPHGPSLHSELGYLVQAGMTGAEAIRAATSAAADAFGLSDRGRIVEGARTDLIVVDGDPLTDLSVVSSPAEVVVGGRRLV